ncbi:hypothetical protein JYU07_00015 [Roseiflexus sp. AH-315-K22]|nr:hypothetical protein [Roseiflexus sp. AH-315-K22]
MSPLPLGLIQMLGSAAASALTPGRGTAAGGASAEGVSFEEMLELAQAGEVSTGQGVSIGPGVDVELSPEQMARLAGAADRALAAGATDVVVMLDGMALRLDVQSREVTGRVNLDEHRELLDVDGIIAAPAALAGGEPLAGPGTRSMNASLMNVLSQSKRAG